MFRITTTLLLAVASTVTSLGRLDAQVDLDPAAVKPAAWERFALRVVNQTDTAFTRVRLTVPEAVMILGVEPLPGWTFTLTAASDTSPQSIEWSEGSHLRGEYREYAFFGRVKADVRRRELVFLVELTRASGSVVEWNRRRETGAPLTVQIVGTTGVTAWASLALAGAAAGTAIRALALAVARRRADGRTVGR